MTVDTDARIVLLNKISLFYSLEDEELKAVAEKFKEEFYKAGDVVFAQNSNSEKFYLIYSGEVRIVRRDDHGKEVLLSVSGDKDYFGEMGLVARRKHSNTVTATKDTTLLVMERQDFEALFKSTPQLRANLDVAVQSRKLARQIHFKWIKPGETVLFLARKHPIVLYMKLILPLFSLGVPLIFLYMYFALDPYFLLKLIGWSFFVGALGWIAWTVVDWGNDYYIVTNRRAVWLEKVVGIYDSRQESPLSMILSVTVETNMLGRMLDYGDVIVKTYVGRIVFQAVSHPEQARHLIEEYWNRSREQAAGLEKDAMKNAIRKQLGLPIPPPLESDQPPLDPIPSVEKTPKRILKFLGANTLKLRYETGDAVVYRKHWILILLRSWFPFSGAIGLLIFIFMRLYRIIISPDAQLFSLAGGIQPDTRLVVYFFLFIPFFLWVAYVIADWSNDKYEVTSDQIIDIDRKPFGTETRRTAKLDSILATYYERRGLLGNIFNYGTVHINVGGSLLDFENVLDPATVQSDIDRRRMANSARQEQAKVNTERDRMAAWLAMYHRSASQFKSEEETNKQKPE